MDGVWSVVYLPRVLLDVVDQDWREDTLEDDELDIHIEAANNVAADMPQDDEHLELFDSVGTFAAAEANWRDLSLPALLGSHTGAHMYGPFADGGSNGNDDGRNAR